jgi:hypothetical protein
MPDAPAISPATASYKWPSKVLRYKITCPFQRMLVVKHEAQIDWDGQIHGTRIESAQALDAHIKDVMLPALHRWMDPGDEKSHYCRQIDLEKMLANPAPHIQEARDLRNREGDEAARRFLLDHINRQKKEQFEGWWDYVMKGNPAYQKHPAFQYLILRPVLESSDAKTTRSPLPVNAEALAHLWDRIKAGRVDPRRTKLVQLLARFMAFGNVADDEKPRFGTDCRWVVIKRTDHNAAGRVAALSQGSGWCVASSGMAASYLQSSDFHLLVEDGRARVALRLAGNQAVEVQGKNNDDPGPWWPRILLYLAARGTRISHRNEQAAREGRRIGKELADAVRRGTQRLGEVLTEQPAKVHLLDSAAAQEDEAAQLVVREAWLSCVRADPMCGGLLPEWMEVDAEVKRAVEEAWGALLIADPLSFQGIPKAIADSPAIIKALRTGWVKLLANDPNQWWWCPKFLHSDIHVVNGRKTGWIKLLQSDPCRWSECPESLQDEFQKNDLFVQKLSTCWIKLLRKCPKQWSECPRFLQIKPSVAQAHTNGWIKCIQDNPRTWHSCPIFLREEAEIIQAFRNGWICSLQRNPDTWNDVPTYLQIDEDLCEVYKMSTLVRTLKKTPFLIDQVSEEIKNRNSFVNAVSNAWQHLVIGYPQDWHWYRRWSSLPVFVRQNHKLRALHTKSWGKLLQRRPEIWDRAPKFVLDDAKIQNILTRMFLASLPRSMSWMPNFIRVDKDSDAYIHALKTGWIRHLKIYPRAWSECPDFLQTSPEVVQALKIGWNRLLDNYPQAWHDCPEFLRRDFQQDVEILEMLRNAWTRFLERDPRGWNQCPSFLQHKFRRDSKTLQMLKTGWVKLLERNPREWSQCAKLLRLEFLKDSSVADTLKSAWIKSLRVDPDKWSDCPDFLSHDTAIVEAHKIGWNQQLEKDPRNWHKCPKVLQQEFQKDAAALQTLRSGWITSLRKDPDKYPECPDFLRTHSEIVQARKAGWIAWLEEQYPATRDTWIERLLKEGVLGWGDLKPHWRKGIQADLSRLEASTFEISPDPLPSYAAASLAALAAEPRATLPVVQTWRHHPRMELANCQKALAALRHFPQNYDTLPPEQKKHALIREAAALGWADWVQKTPEAASKVPAEFQDHPEVAEQVRQALARSLEMKLKQVEGNPSITDEQLEHLAIPAANRKMRKTIRTIRLKYWKVQVKKDWRNWSTMPPSLQQEEEVLKVMREGLGPELRRAPGLWARLPEDYRQDECLQRVHRYATRD